MPSYSGGCPSDHILLAELVGSIRSGSGLVGLGMIIDGSRIAEAVKAAERHLGGVPPEDRR